MITVPAFRTLWTSHDDHNQHWVRYTVPTLLELIDEAGLSCYEMKYFFHALAGAKLVARALEKMRHTTPRPARVPPRFVNSLALAACRFEQTLLARIRIPFGSSLFSIVGPPATGPTHLSDSHAVTASGGRNSDRPRGKRGLS